MRPFLHSLLVFAALWLTTACEIQRTLTIKPDGTGQIAEHYLASKDSFKKEKKPGDDAAPPALDFSMPRPTQDSVAKDAKKLGEGIKLISFKPLETKDMLGYDAVYEFTDVSQLHADMFLNHEEHGLPGQKADRDPNKNFKFTKGPVSELSVPVKLVQGDQKETPQAQAPAQDPKQQAAFVEALKHLHIRTAIVVQGTIVETNAHFRKDNEIVLSEMNLTGLSADPKYASLFQDAAAGKPMPKEPPADDRYIKREEADVVKIRFK